MVILKRIGVLKSACFLGLFGVFVGFIFGLIVSVISSIFHSATSSVSGIGNIQNITAIFSITSINGWLSIFFIALAFGVLSFLVGLIFTPLMNLTLKIVKGLDLDIEMQEGQPVVNS